MCASSPLLTEDKSLNVSDIINSLIDYEGGQEELDSFTADKIYIMIQLSNKTEKHFLKIDTNSESCPRNPFCWYRPKSVNSSGCSTDFGTPSFKGPRCFSSLVLEVRLRPQPQSSVFEEEKKHGEGNAEDIEEALVNCSFTPLIIPDWRA
ncbi:hypothetical protein TNCV_2022601 [Trichonephila clavipes]|nr:hypothetical protein TNCV_2022601 [Trichonephila clavipes]